MIICSPQLGLNPNSTLGGEVFDREVLFGLAKKAIKIEIILPKSKPADKNVKNWNITRLPFNHFPAIFANLIYLPYVLSIYKRTKFKVLRLHQPQFLFLIGIIFKVLFPQVKLLVTFHQFKETKFGPFSKILNNVWDHIICDSANVKKQIMSNYHIAGSKITVVHNGVPNYLKPSKKNHAILKHLRIENKFVLLFMGFFIERKNPLFLIDVLDKLKAKFPNVVLIYWGSGPLKEAISNRAQSKHIDAYIRFIKPVHGLKKNVMHNIADVFVHPSLNEGFALAPLEAMACAKPVVISNAHSAKEAVDDKINGFVCKSNDVSDWVKKLQQLIISPSMREKMGFASLQKVKREFTWAITIQKHIEVLKQFK